MKSTKGNRVGWIRIVGYYLLGVMAGIMGLVAIMRLVWHTKFYPRIMVGGVAVSGLTREQARTRLEQMTTGYQAQIEYGGGRWILPKGAVTYEIEPSLNAAYHYGRKLAFTDYLLLLINQQTNFPLLLAEGQSEQMGKAIAEIASAVEIPEQEAEVVITKKGITIENGQDGVRIDGQKLDLEIRAAYANLKSEMIPLPTTTVERRLGEEELKELASRAERLLNKKLDLGVDDEKMMLTGSELIPFLATWGSEVVEKEKVQEFVEGLAEAWNRDPQDAKFEFEEGKVKEFAPGRDGVEIEVQVTSEKLQAAIVKLLDSEEKEVKVEVVVIRTPPKVTTEKVNELGIRERIGRGESYYAHSIPNRIYNVALASERINSALIRPGEEVSFNKMVGEVSGATGYRPAYIIEKGRTVLGDGGGLCQVSTTMFRAAMSAGLPILERWGHAYRVSYYELDSKPGVDATVIAPSKDFRFKNDTPGHILIQTINDPKALHLVIEIYGTNDGRVASIENHKVWGITPPLPTIYQDDPSLPAGTMRQVDWAASGARASFEYRVVRNGETIQDKTFSTVYRPWASVYLRGTGI